MHRRRATASFFAPIRTALSLALGLAVVASPAGAQDVFRAATGGTELVHDKARLPDGSWFEIARPVPEARRARVEAILAREAAKYPPGFLAGIGLRAVGVFSGLASTQNDGFHTWDESLGGYLYYGLWNGRDAVMVAWYSDAQVVLTFHHEVFHHIDSVVRGAFQKGAFHSDDARFARAVSGEEPYEPAVIEPALLKRLRALSGRKRLADAVSDYCTKNPGEDQAETARWFMTNLAGGLVQAADAPELPGSQRILHLLEAYRSAAPAGGRVFDANVLARVALGDPIAPETVVRTVRRVDPSTDPVERHLKPKGEFVVRGKEGPDGVNRTLQADILAVPTLVRTAPDPRESSRHALTLLERYEAYIASRWSVSESTRAVFERVRVELIALTSGVRLETKRNRHSDKVDEAIADPRLRAVIHGVQPATVRLTRENSGGSGVVISERGRVLTAGHVAPTLGARLTAELPDGRRFEAVAIAVDLHLDLALLQLTLPRGTRLVAASIADTAPALGDRVVTIGQPGSTTPDGEQTGYPSFHVSVGKLRKFAKNRLGGQALGGTGHDAWTYWGHSGAPLFNDRGHIVALHNSWDSTTTMRHAVTWEAITYFLKQQ
ncbi:MAG: trypsin-like peptidase domain-containing protein [Myxococcales bacterium]|nr:trypsin-like peptidase domain-containing protein [Myxococcales bacterium]